jgi:hypothetical protein
MPRVGFEPKTQVFDLAKVFHALDRAATVIGQAGPYSEELVRVLMYWVLRNVIYRNQIRKQFLSTSVRIPQLNLPISFIYGLFNQALWASEPV